MDTHIYTSIFIYVFGSRMKGNFASLGAPILFLLNEYTYKSVDGVVNSQCQLSKSIGFYCRSTEAESEGCLSYGKAIFQRRMAHIF